MPQIYVQTFPLGNNKYQLVRAKAIGAWFQSEDVQEYEADNRLRAVIINVGLACKYLYDCHRDKPGNLVRIVTDKDGKDTKYGGEQDIVYSLLCPQSDWEAKKVVALYGEYLKYLNRIRELRHLAKIKITLMTEDEVV